MNSSGLRGKLFLVGGGGGGGGVGMGSYICSYQEFNICLNRVGLPDANVPHST